MKCAANTRITSIVVAAAALCLSVACSDDAGDVSHAAAGNGGTANSAGKSAAAGSVVGNGGAAGSSAAGGIANSGAAGEPESGGTVSAGASGSATGGTAPLTGAGGRPSDGIGGSSVTVAIAGMAGIGGIIVGGLGGTAGEGATPNGGVAQTGAGSSAVGTGGLSGIAGSGGGIAGSPGATCPWFTQADLDNDVSDWAIYQEGSPTGAVANVAAPSTGDGTALRCSLTGGTPYSNVHCYRNLAIAGDPKAFLLRMSFWHSPPSTLNNAGQPSVVQAIEFSLSKWQGEARYELALQWQNVGTGAPQWRYWDPNQPSAQRWVGLGLTQELIGEQWHSLELRGEGSNGSVHYSSFALDGTVHPLNLTVPAASAPGETDRLAVAMQLDGNSTETPWDLMVDNLQLVTCDGPPCPAPNLYYKDRDGDGLGDAQTSVVVCQQPAGYVAVGGDCNDADSLSRPASATPTFDLNRCGEGSVVDGMEWSAGADGWQLYVDGLGSTASGSAATGCYDNGMTVAYSLAASAQPNWIVLRKVLPIALNLSSADFLLAPFKGNGTGLARSVEFKLEDSNGCRSAVVFTAATSLPVFRTADLSLQQFTRPEVSSCAGTPVDLTKIEAIELGISENGDDVPTPELAASGQVTFDDLTFISRAAMVTPQAYFECIPERGDVKGRIARNFLRRQKAHGLIPSWFPEATPNYFTYTEALNLIVLSKEFARTGRTEYRVAAKALADRLVALQSGGAWLDNYVDNGTGGLAAGSSYSWVGNVAWAVIGLKSFVENASPADATPYQGSIQLARTWLEQQILAYQTAGGATGGITDGTEGNVSTYLALVAAGATTSAQAMSQFLTTQAWDNRERHLRMGVKYWGLAIDVMGNWGAEFLRDIHDDAGALDGLSLAAAIFPVRGFTSSVVGMGDIAGPWTPTVEFTGQYAAAGGRGAAWLMDQMLLLEEPNDPGAFPGAADEFGGGDGWNTSMTGSAPGAWVYLSCGRTGLVQ